MKKRITVNPLLHRTAVAHAEALGYASVDEFVAHLIEREVARPAASQDQDEVTNRLRGLGYLS